MVRRWALPVLLALLPLLHTARVVAGAEVDVPYGDDWEMVPVLAGLAEGRLPGELVAGHDAHRLLLPRVGMAAVAFATGWDQSWSLALSLLVAVGSAALLGARAARTTGSAWGVPLASALVLSLVHYENWVWAWQLQIVSCVLASVGAIFALEWPTRERLVLGGLLALAAAFSFASGLLLAPIGLLLLLCPVRPPPDPEGAPQDDPLRARRRPLAAVWAVAWLAIGLPYVSGLPRGADPPGLAQGAEYLLAWLGAPLTAGLFAPGEAGVVARGGAALVGLAGLVGVGLLARQVVVDREWRLELRGWLALAALGLGTGLLCALGRAASLGVAQARSSRYYAFSSLVWLALAVACLRVAADPERRRRERGLAAAVVAVVVGLTALGATRLAPGLVEARRAFLTRVAWRLRETGQAEPLLGSACTPGAVAWVRSQGWSVFRADPGLPPAELERPTRR